MINTPVARIARAVFALGILLWAPLAGAQSPTYQVSGVSVEGNRRIDASAIQQQIRGKSGAVPSSQISDDVRTLYNTGFFDQVAVSAVPSDSGGVILKYALVEKPVVRKIFIKGNKEVKEDDLANIMKFEARRFLDKTKVDVIIKRAGSYYQSQGFYDAKLQSSIVPVGDNQVDVTFTVTEGEKYRVRQVAIRGLKSLDEDDIATELQTKRYKWWSSWLFGTGRVNTEMLDGDKQIIRQYFLDHGYVDGTVGEAAVEKTEDGLQVVFDVTEGAQYQIGTIRASGDLVDKSIEKTVEGIKSKSGEVFNASQVRADIFTITDKFSDKGFAFANVVPNTNVRRGEGIVDIDFAVSKGQLVRVNRINISGNEKTYDNVIRREVRIGEQDTYSGSKVKRSQVLLERLGYFEEVNITNEPTTDPAKVDLNVNVREGSTGSFSAGAGYSTSDGALFNTRISENNILGTGRRANLNLDFGTERNNQILSLDDPRVFDSRVSAGADFFRTDREFNDFNRNLLGTAFTLGYPAEELLGEWAEDIQFSAKYDYTKIDINEVEEEAAQLIKDFQGTSTSSSVTPMITRNTINNPLNPSRGSKQVLSYEIAGLGGNEDFYLFEFRNSWYYPLYEASWGDIVVSDRTSLGYGESNSDRPFPLFRRYFPGGINSVRGFKNRTLGPKDANGSEFGGSKQIVNNAELIFPLLNSAGIKGMVFYDIGNAFDDDESMNFGDLRRSWGYGIRWASPLGPIRVEFGYPLGREEGEKKMVPMFSFGAPL